MKNTLSPRKLYIMICASCGRSGGTLVKIDNYYYHQKCKHVPNKVLLGNIRKIKDMV